MKRNIFNLALVLALFTGFVLAQNPGAQNPPAQSQPTPQAQQPTPDTQTPASGQSQPQATPPGAQANTPGAQIQAALQKEAALSNVMVNETSDKIELAGTVATDADKDKARSIAEANAGGRKVVNNIKVGGNASAPSTTSPPTR